MVSERTGKQRLDKRVMEVMGRAARHEFVRFELRQLAYADTPLPIGYEKTISQPFIVALMTDLLGLGDDDTVLEIGTGLGYQAAILAHLAKQVYSIEVVEELAKEAEVRLKRFGFDNLELRAGNGYNGWPEHAPFDAIIVTAAPDLIPPPLIQQLKPGGRMVLPAGNEDAQQLMVVERDKNGRISTREIIPVNFSTLETPD
ncbi:MAG: protein-L-isoaspartate(D-aspartate) O-methyltransferase [Proteobacteria bacterium]|nr:protein-L-isoaspartate(D-aspartate) O-methyltransferase [Pseudomonadota bacterium]